jgi:hypothetical protein
MKEIPTITVNSFMNVRIVITRTSCIGVLVTFSSRPLELSQTRKQLAKHGFVEDKTKPAEEKK